MKFNYIIDKMWPKIESCKVPLVIFYSPDTGRQKRPLILLNRLRMQRSIEAFRRNALSDNKQYCFCSLYVHVKGERHIFLIIAERN